MMTGSVSNHLWLFARTDLGTWYNGCMAF